MSGAARRERAASIHLDASPLPGLSKPAAQSLASSDLFPRATVSTVLLPILVFTVPVLAIVFLALGGRRLSGSCGGTNPDGSCKRCGKAGDAPGVDAGEPCHR